MLKYLLSMIFLFLFASSIFCQSDCPGGIADSLTESTYKWYWDEDFDGAYFTRTWPFTEDLETATKVLIVRSAISSALSQFTSQTYGTVSFSEGDSTDTDALKIEFTPMDANA